MQSEFNAKIWQPIETEDGRCTYCGQSAKYVCTHEKMHKGRLACENCALIGSKNSPMFLTHDCVVIGVTRHDPMYFHIGKNSHLLSQKPYCDICYPIQPLLKKLEEAALNDFTKIGMIIQLQRFYKKQELLSIRAGHDLFRSCIDHNKYYNYEQLTRLLTN
jgi:hypothetical protein